MYESLRDIYKDRAEFIKNHGVTPNLIYMPKNVFIKIFEDQDIGEYSDTNVGWKLLGMDVEFSNKFCGVFKRPKPVINILKKEEKPIKKIKNNKRKIVLD